MSKSVRGYNRIASAYVWLEYFVFANDLMKARLALVDHLLSCKHVLILGEGDGRFLAACLERLPDTKFTVVEQSPKMIALTKKRINEDARVSFVCDDVFAFLDVSVDSFDGLVTCFFLDLFDKDSLTLLFEKLCLRLDSGAFWYFVDFSLPLSGLKRFVGQAYFRLMLWFFAWQTNFGLRELVNPHNLFGAFGFTMVIEERRRFDFLLSRLYKFP